MTSETKRWEFHIAGVQHHKLHVCIDELEIDQYLSLVREPTNKHDPCAVQIICPTIEWDEVMIGYVPQRISPHVNAAIVDEKSVVSCKILEVNPEEKPWKQCKVAVERSAKNV